MKRNPEAKRRKGFVKVFRAPSSNQVADSFTCGRFEKRLKEEEERTKPAKGLRKNEKPEEWASVRVSAAVTSDSVKRNDVVASDGGGSGGDGGCRRRRILVVMGEDNRCPKCQASIENGRKMCYTLTYILSLYICRVDQECHESDGVHTDRQPRNDSGQQQMDTKDGGQDVDLEFEWLFDLRNEKLLFTERVWLFEQNKSRQKPEEMSFSNERRPRDHTQMHCANHFVSNWAAIVQISCNSFI